MNQEARSATLLLLNGVRDQDRIEVNLDVLKPIDLEFVDCGCRIFEYPLALPRFTTENNF